VKILTVEGVLFHTDRQTDMKKVNSRFSQIYEHPKNSHTLKYYANEFGGTDIVLLQIGRSRSCCVVWRLGYKRSDLDLAWVKMSLFVRVDQLQNRFKAVYCGKEDKLQK